MKYACVITSEKKYKTFVQIQTNITETGEEQEIIYAYNLLPGEELVEVSPPILRYDSSTPGLISPVWNGAQWIESATAEEIEDWENQHPAPEVKKDMSSQIYVAMLAFASTSTSIPNNYALQMPDLFPVWEDILHNGSQLSKGTILRDGNQLYRVNQDNVLPQEHQPPHGEGMTAVYVPINKENSGSLEDPIPSVRGMEYVYGKYYLDPEDNNIYLCKRVGEDDGSTVILQYLPHDLIGQYFVLVSE